MEKFAVFGGIVGFVLFFLLILTIVGFVSGWFRLRRSYPDRPQTVLRRMRYISCRVGTAHFVLTLEACDGGLRLRMPGPIGLLYRPILIPWQAIRVTRRDFWLWQSATLEFGQPRAGRLRFEAYVADKLAAAAGSRWPEGRVFPQPASRAFIQIGLQWLIGSALFAAFFAFVHGQDTDLPVGYLIAIPVAMVTVACIIRLIRRLS